MKEGAIILAAAQKILLALLDDRSHVADGPAQLVELLIVEGGDGRAKLAPGDRLGLSPESQQLPGHAPAEDLGGQRGRDQGDDHAEDDEDT